VGLIKSVILQEDGATAHYAADVLFSPKRSVYTSNWATWTSYLTSLKSQPARVTADCGRLWRRHNSHEICSWGKTWNLPCLQHHYATLLKGKIPKIVLNVECTYVCHEPCQNMLKHNTKSSILSQNMTHKIGNTSDGVAHGTPLTLLLPDVLSRLHFNHSPYMYHHYN
jgi:hypothetical protein